MEAMKGNDALREGAKRQSGCSTCQLGCPTATATQGFPKAVRDRMDALVARMGAFRVLCIKSGIRCGGEGGAPNGLTNEAVGEFAAIVGDYNSLLSSYGEAHPTLKHSLGNMVGLHANDVFSYLAKKARR